MNENTETITKEYLQEQVVSTWINEGVLFTGEQTKETTWKNANYCMWFGDDYDWKEDTQIHQWAKETLESEEKMIAELYPEGYEVTVTSGDTQKTYTVEKVTKGK